MLTNIKAKSKKQSVEQVWGALKQTVKEVTDMICKNKHRNRQHKYWITSETITLIEERKKIKAKDIHTEREQTLYKHTYASKYRENVARIKITVFKRHMKKLKDIIIVEKSVTYLRRSIFLHGSLLPGC